MNPRLIFPCESPDYKDKGKINESKDGAGNRERRDRGLRVGKGDRWQMAAPGKPYFGMETIRFRRFQIQGKLGRLKNVEVWFRSFAAPSTKLVGLYYLIARSRSRACEKAAYEKAAFEKKDDFQNTFTL